MYYKGKVYPTYGHKVVYGELMLEN